jgi:hypothetical protein
MNDIFKMAEQAYHALSIAESELKRLYKENAELRQALEQPQTRVGEMEWQWGYERGWDAAMNQKREWVGLTDAQVEEIAEYHGIDCLYETSRIDFYRAIEAKLKEKNT